MDARRVVVVVGGVDGLVPVGFGAAAALVLLPGGHYAHDEPASDFADEHLGRLEHGLLKGLVLLGVGVVAVTHALVVLGLGWLAI